MNAVRAGFSCFILIAALATLSVGAMAEGGTPVSGQSLPAKSGGIGALATPPEHAESVSVTVGYMGGDVFSARYGDIHEGFHVIGIVTGDRKNFDCLAREAYAALFYALHSDEVLYIETGPEVRDGDGNLYAHVWYRAKDGYRLLSETLLAEGLAGFVEPDRDHAEYTEALRDALEYAQKSEVGIWGECDGDIHKRVVRCETPHAGIVEFLDGQLTGNRWLRGAQAVRAPQYLSNLYLLGADIEGPGTEGPDQIGVWVVYDSIEELHYNIDTLPGPAEGYEILYYPLETFISVDPPAGYDEVIDCVRKELG
ncbi:MAG: thermonuclease family protein [Candidatus Binatia bacterium]